MALLERVSTLVRANLNDLIDKAEEPEKMIKQIILDMQNQLMQVKTQVAIAIADEHLLEKKKKENQDKQAECQNRERQCQDERDRPNDGIHDAEEERREEQRADAMDPHPRDPHAREPQADRADQRAQPKSRHGLAPGPGCRSSSTLSRTMACCQLVRKRRY